MSVTRCPIHCYSRSPSQVTARSRSTYPWSIPQLAADKQYSVVVDGGTGTVTAIVSEFASRGDNAMIYEGFAAIP